MEKYTSSQTITTNQFRVHYYLYAFSFVYKFNDRNQVWHMCFKSKIYSLVGNSKQNTCGEILHCLRYYQKDECFVF